MVKWQRILKEHNIVVGMQARGRKGAVRQLATVLQDDPAVLDQGRFLREILSQEKVGWSCIGKGVALPHVHGDYIARQVLGIGIAPEGIDFGAIDGQEVRILAMMATPLRHQKQHMQVLAGLSRLLQNAATRQRLIEAADPAAVLEVFSPAA